LVLRLPVQSSQSHSSTSGCALPQSFAATFPFNSSVRWANILGFAARFCIYIFVRDSLRPKWKDERNEKVISRGCRRSAHIRMSMEFRRDRGPNPSCRHSFSLGTQSTSQGDDLRDFHLPMKSHHGSPSVPATNYFVT
jgi:hypothetical protein